MTAVPHDIASRYGSPNPSYVLGAAHDPRAPVERRKFLVGNARESRSRPCCVGPLGPTNINSASGNAGRITRSKMSSRNLPRLRPSSAPTNTIDGCGDLPVGMRLKDRGVDAIRDDLPHERIVTLRVGADADDADGDRQRRHQFLQIHTELQDGPADRRRMLGLAEGAAVHDAHDRLAAHREQQAVAVRDDDIELAHVDLQARGDCPDIQRSCGVPAQVSTNDFHGSARTSYAAPAGLGSCENTDNRVAAARETLGKHMRDALDAAALLAFDRQPVAEDGDLHRRHCSPAALCRISAMRGICAAGSHNARARAGPVGAQALAPAAIVEQRRQLRGERRRIAGRHENAARLVDNLLRAAERGRHDRQTRRHRFDQADAEGLGLDVRLAVDVGVGEKAMNVGTLAEKFDAIGDTQRGRTRAKRCHVLRLVRTLRSAGEPAYPPRPIAQLRKRVEQHGVPLQRLHPADLNDDARGHWMRLCARHVRVLVSIGAYTTSTRASDFGSVEAVNRLLQTIVPGLHAPCQPIEPMTAGRHVHPQDEGDRMALRDAAEERERPRLMAHHDVGTVAIRGAWRARAARASR